MNIEKTTAYISYGVTLISASIYCFSLGYLEYFKVIDFPSFFNSHVFFFSTLLNKSILSIQLEPASKVDMSSSISIFSLVATLTGFLSAEFFRVKSKGSQEFKAIFDKISNIAAVFGSLIISLLAVILVAYMFKEAILFALPVLIVPVGIFYVIVTIFEKYEESKKGTILKSTQIGELVVLVAPLLIAWTIPYYMGQTVASKLNPVKSFPAAWSGTDIYSTSDLLVWKEDEKGFWLNCKEKVIYGVTNDGHIFFSRNTSALDKVNCQ